MADRTDAAPVSGDVVKSMRYCLSMDEDARRQYRDDWTNTFKLLRKPALMSSPYKGPLVVALDFLEQLPEVSKVHKSQAAESKLYLLRQAVVQEVIWDEEESETINGERPPDGERRPSATSRSPEPMFRCSSLLAIITLSCIIYDFLRFSSLVNLLRSLASGNQDFDWCDYVDFSWLLLSLLMLCQLFYFCLEYLRLSFTAAIAVMAFGILIVVVFLSLLWILLRPTGLDVHFALPAMTVLMPLYSSTFGQIARCLAHCLFKLRHDPCDVCHTICRYSKIYTNITFAKQERGLRGLVEPMMSSDRTQQPSMTSYAEFLQKHAVEELCDMYRQAKVETILNSKRTTRLCDLCRFLGLYLPFMFSVMRESFKRSLALAKVKRGIKVMRDNAEADEANTWQVMLDQYDWYLKNGYCLSDILEKLVCYDEKAGHVLWLFKCLDDATAFWWMLLGQKGLWVPSPEQREKDLFVRQRLVTTLCQGKHLR